MGDATPTTMMGKAAWTSRKVVVAKSNDIREGGDDEDEGGDGNW